MQTEFGALTNAQKKVWSTKLFKHGRDMSFWKAGGFLGEPNDQNAVIHRVTELTATDRGDRAVMQLVADMVGDGVVGDNMLDGNEEALFNDDIEIVIDQLRSAVRNKGEMAEQRTVIRFRETAKDKLGFWLAEKQDELAFLTVAGIAYTKKLNGAARTGSQMPNLAFAGSVSAPSTNRIMYAGSATSTGTLTTADKVTWNLCVAAQAKAKREKIRPIRQGGKEYYVLLLSTEQCRDLKLDTNYQTNVGRAAGQGQDKNPLFRNAVAVIQGLIIHDHNKVPTTFGLTSGVDKWGSGDTVDGAQAMLLGAQALGWAEIGGPFWREADRTDFGNRPAIATGSKFGLKKPVFKSPTNDNSKEDFGVISIYTAAAAT